MPASRSWEVDVINSIRNRLRIGVAAGAAMILTTVAGAFGMGTVTIHRADGTSSTYRGASVTIAGTSLRVRSPDHKGVLVIDRAACSHQGAVLMCLPTRVVLRQHGLARVMSLESGTVYFNFTGVPQQLNYSSQRLRPHGVLLSLHTARGTLINVDGTLDGGVPAQ